MGKELCSHYQGVTCDIAKAPIGCEGQRPTCLYPSEFGTQPPSYAVFTEGSAEPFLLVDEKTRGLLEGQAGIVFEQRPLAREVMKSRLTVIEGGKGL